MRELVLCLAESVEAAAEGPCPLTHRCGDGVRRARGSPRPPSVLAEAEAEVGTELRPLETWIHVDIPSLLYFFFISNPVES